MNEMGVTPNECSESEGLPGCLETEPDRTSVSVKKKGRDYFKFNFICYGGGGY